MHRLRSPLVFLSISTLLASVPLAACSNSDTNIAIDVTAGQETDAFADAGITRVQVTVSGAPIDTSLNATATASPNGGTLDFGEIPSTEQVTITANGFANNDSTALMTGQSLSGLLLSAVSSEIPVFIQRRGQWARPPGGLACTHVNGVVSVQENRGFMITGGTSPSTNASGCVASDVDVYDMFALTGDNPTPAYGLVPQTIVSLLASDNSDDAQGLFISGSNGTFWDYDTAQDNTACPTGFTAWSTVAGGAPIAGDAGVFWVVGGTRTTSSSNAVAEVTADCNTSGFTLNTARKGAAATWIEGTGLVVAGGSATGYGFEILPAGGLANGLTTFNGQCPAVSTEGASIVTGMSGFWLVGGTNSDAAQRVTYFGFGDTGDCGVPYATSQDLPPLTNTAAFGLTPSSSTLLFGTDATGMNASFLLDVSKMGIMTITPIPFREPRSGASAIAGPTGAVGVLGGVHADGTPALSIELFVP